MRKPVAMSLILLAALAAVFWAFAERKAPTLSADAFAERYRMPLPKPEQPPRVFHLGHSLIGRDMPVMLAQLMGNDHDSQLGWGASLMNHWEGEIPGFAEENAHPNYQPAKFAKQSGAYDAVVLTEMVELRDAIRWHQSAQYLTKWAQLARQGNPDIRIYLYETWHRLDDPQGWLERIDTDLRDLWETELLRPAMAQPDVGTIYVIPGGQVMGAAVRAIEAGDLPGLTQRSDLFAKTAQGAVDPIHLNDLGAYLIALTHYAVLMQASPVGLPRQLHRADGSPTDPIRVDTAQALQQLVWQVIARYPATGVVQKG